MAKERFRKVQCKKRNLIGFQNIETGEIYNFNNADYSKKRIDEEVEKLNSDETFKTGFACHPADPCWEPVENFDN